MGRAGEFTRFEGALDAIGSGAPQFVVVSGEPGIGKSRLLAELAARGDARGYLVLDGTAAEFEQELPFRVVADACDAYLRSLGSAALDRTRCRWRERTGSVFPSLASLGTTATVPTTAAERFRVYHAVRELIERLAVSRPLLLVLDDLHWADQGTVELLASLVQRPPHAAAGVAVTTVELGPLDVDEAVCSCIMRRLLAVGAAFGRSLRTV